MLTKLRVLYLSFTQVADAGCVALASALDSGMLPALERVSLEGTPASSPARAAVREALARNAVRRLERAGVPSWEISLLTKAREEMNLLVN